MSKYDRQYKQEEDLFGPPYREFEEFIKTYAHTDGSALDLGCGQGRDALLLARNGYTVTGVDSSKVGVAQMLERAGKEGLHIEGVVADIYEYKPNGTFDAVVLDSILHFYRADRRKELALLDRAGSCLNRGGYLCLFIHKSKKKEKALKSRLSEIPLVLHTVKEDYIDYTYEEKTTGFKSAFRYFMLIVRREDGN